MNIIHERVWLRRFSDHTFSRPMSESDLMKLFESGSMNPTDELCAANDYWFSVQDVNEMRKHFGNIQMEGIFRKIKEEITEERMVSTARIVASELKGYSPHQAMPGQGSAKTPHSAMPSQPVEGASQSRLVFKIILLVLTLLILLRIFY